MSKKLVPAALAAVLLALPAAASAAPREPSPADGYIVVYEDSVGDVDAATRSRERARGFRSRLRYRRALKGFAAQLSNGQVAALRRDPDVAFVSPDRRVRALGTAPLAAGEAIPTGVQRIGAATATAVRQSSGAGVAVIDSGVDLDHADLNVADGVDCVAPGTSAEDENGHGTHVAGTVGARNTGAGVVGVAPGTPVHAVRVLDGAGNGTWSQIICGIDWVTANAATRGIKVANMSLGGLGTAIQACTTTTDALHRAICNSTAAGITYVVAAGNDGWDFDYAPTPDVPAAYPQVLTVSALADTDGRPGAAGGAPACQLDERDDRYATFSNYAATSAGAAHTIAAPGTCIRSTWLAGGHGTSSGTSMAAPHVAAAVALCIDDNGAAGPCAGKAPPDVIRAMRANAEAFNAAQPAYGFTGDPLRPVTGRFYGYLPSAASAPAPVSVAPSAVAVSTGALRGGTAASLAADDNAVYQVDSTTTGTPTAVWVARFYKVPADIASLAVNYRGSNSRACTQSLAIYDWTTAKWLQIDSRSIGTTETGLTVLPPAPFVRFRGGSQSEVKLRLRCSTSASFSSAADLLRIEYTRP